MFGVTRQLIKNLFKNEFPSQGKALTLNNIYAIYVLKHIIIN